MNDFTGRLGNQNGAEASPENDRFGEAPPGLTARLRPP
jgi:hypothetical protein